MGQSLPKRPALQVWTPYGHERQDGSTYVAITGACDTLGDWDVHKMVRMKKAADGKWELDELPEDVPPGIEYKYVIINNEGHGGDKWMEECPNRHWPRVVDHTVHPPEHRFNEWEPDLGWDSEYDLKILAEAGAEIKLLWGNDDTRGDNSWPPGQSAAICHAFHWQFDKVSARAKDIADSGFDAVQISPAQHSRETPFDAKEPKDAWFWRYQPVNYEEIRGLGNAEELAAACAACKAEGMSVIADVVFNHMIVLASSTEWEKAQSDPRSFESLKQKLEKSVGPGLDRRDFQWPWIKLEGELWDEYPYRFDGWGNGEWSTLNLYSPKVVDVHEAHMKLLMECGCTGFRIDAAKHMRPEVVANYKKLAEALCKSEAVFVYAEVLTNEDAIHKEYLDALPPSSRYPKQPEDNAARVVARELRQKWKHAESQVPRLKTLLKDTEADLIAQRKTVSEALEKEQEKAAGKEALTTAVEVEPKAKIFTTLPSPSLPQRNPRVEALVRRVEELKAQIREAELEEQRLKALMKQLEVDVSTMRKAGPDRAVSSPGAISPDAKAGSAPKAVNSTSAGNSSRTTNPMSTTDFQLAIWMRKLIDVGEIGWAKLKCKHHSHRYEVPMLARNSVRFLRNHDTIGNEEDICGLGGISLAKAAIAQAWLLAAHDGIPLVLAEDVFGSKLIRDAARYRRELRKRFAKLPEGAKSVWTDARVRGARRALPPGLICVSVRLRFPDKPPLASAKAKALARATAVSQQTATSAAMARALKVKAMAQAQAAAAAAEAEDPSTLEEPGAAIGFAVLNPTVDEVDANGEAKVGLTLAFKSSDCLADSEGILFVRVAEELADSSVGKNGYPVQQGGSASSSLPLVGERLPKKVMIGPNGMCVPPLTMPPGSGAFYVRDGDAADLNCCIKSEWVNWSIKDTGFNVADGSLQENVPKSEAYDPALCQQSNTAQLAFTLENTTTEMGQKIVVVGNVPELGNWNPDEGVVLYTDDASYPTWHGSVLLDIKSINQQVVYKYVSDFRQCGGSFDWETSERRISIPRSRDERMQHNIGIVEWGFQEKAPPTPTGR